MLCDTIEDTLYFRTWEKVGQTEDTGAQFFPVELQCSKKLTP